MFLVPVRVVAQFNDSITHYVYYGSSGTFNKTNDGNSFVLNNNGKFTLEKKKVSFHSINTWIYGEQSGVLINNDFSSVLDCDILKKQQKFYYWAIGTFDKSFSLKINHRFQAGGGLGYNLLKKEHASIVVSDGLIYEQADLTDNELGHLNYDVWRTHSASNIIGRFTTFLSWMVQDFYNRHCRRAMIILLSQRPLFP